MSKEKINFTEFLEISNRLEIKVGKVIDAVRIPKKDKLIQLGVSFLNDARAVVTNLGSDFEPEDFIGKEFNFITNLEVSKIGGVESEAMIMVGTDVDGNIDLDCKTGSILM